MEVFDVVVEGFPSTMAQKKIELFIKGRFRKEFEVEKIGEGRVGIKICDAKDVHAFPHHSMREVLFGSQSYPLTYLKSPIEIPDTSEDLRMHIYHGEDLQQLPASSGSIWNDNPVGTTGSKNSAESAPENVNICTELKTVEVPIDEDEFRTLTLCGIIEDLKKNFWNASFEFSSVRNLLTVIAPDRDLPMIQKKIWKNSIKERRIADLNESVRRYLIETIAVNRAKIQDEILAKDIKAEFVPNASGVYIKSKCEEDHTKVANVIRRLTWVSNLDVSGPKAEVIEKEKWKEFVQKIAKENCAVYEKGCKSIDIVGLKDVDADVIREKFRLFFEEHVIRVATVPLNQCQAKFVLDYCERFNVNNPKRKALKHFSQLSKHGGTLRLEGTEKSIQEAQLEINQIVAGIVTEKHSRSNPAIKRYYMDPANQGVMENIRRATNCYIEAMPPKLFETKGTKKTKLEPKNVPRTSLFSTQLGKLTMRICMVDIVSHTADGIVNIVTHGHSTSADEYNATVDKSRKRFQIEPARFNHSMEGAASVQKLKRSQNFDETPMDDLNGILKESVQHLRLSQNFDETSLDHLQEISKTIFKFLYKPTVLDMICDVLLKEGILKTFVRLWDRCHENPNAFYSNTEHVLFKILKTMKRILLNFSDECKSLAAACFKDDALIDRLMKDFTLPQLNVQKLAQPSLSYMIEADLAILHNLVRNANQIRNHIRRNNGIEKIFAYKNSQPLYIKAYVFFVLAYCINEEENSIIESGMVERIDNKQSSQMQLDLLILIGAKVIPFILKMLKSAVSTVTHVGNMSMSMSTITSSFSVEEILGALNKLASNDGNKKAIVDAGILPIVTKLFDPDSSSATENLEAVNLIRLLALHTDNKQKIIQEPGLLEGVRKLRDLKGVSDRMTKAVGSLMIVLKLEQVTSQSHNKEDTREANQTKKKMKSVNRNKRNLLPIEAVITNGGNLPNCQKIVNVVGPELEGASDIEQKRLVVSCIKNILEVAEEENLTSIAIPAMGWGGSRINPNAVTPHIVNAVSQYFEGHPKSCITRVDFVEFKNQEVLDEFQKVLWQIEIRPTVTARPTTVVQIGDIAKQNADAVVNIMAKYQIADMTKGSVIAKVLAAGAGADVVKECAQNSGKYNDGDIFVTRAGSLHCKNIIHGIVSTYDCNSEDIVKKIVQKSLQHASQANYRSIVFPAIGTGGFNMPPNEVAMWMKKAINNYGPKSTHVKIVLHVSNPKALHAFQAEFNQTNMITSSYANYGSLNVCITDGDILQRNEDVIVNSADMTFDLMRAGPLSAAILREGGSEIQNELKNSSGDMAVTSGGKLPCKHIIHLVSRTEDRQLRKTIVKVLMKADSLKASSIAFPALGTGNINKPAKDAASLLHSALQEFIQNNPTPQNLKRMTVVVYNKTLIQDYITIMVGYRVMRKKTFKAKARGFAEFCSSVFEKNTAHQAVDFHFYASDKKDIVKALECIDEKTTEILCKEQIEDSALDTVTDLEMLEFQEKAEEKNVSIQRLSINSTGLLVTGLENDVKVFSDYSRKILRELVVAQTCVEFVTWETEIEQKWYEFPPRPAHLLEKAYQKNKHHPGPVQIKVVENGQIVSKSYDLSTLDKKNSTIRRRQTENYELPAGWDPMQGLHVRRIVLNDTSEEYKRVLNVCKKKGLPVQTAMIERIQNISLYKKYAAEKAEVTEKLEDENVRIERELFHGTGKADKIVKRGFNRSFAGENGARFGNGVYFSTSAKYSHDFTNRGARTIFLANVITGTYTQGSPGMKTAPDRSDNDLHDSVVDDVNNPTMFVVFKDASTYPTYLIEYT